MEKRNIIIFIVLFSFLLMIFFSHIFFPRKKEESKKYPYKRKNAMKPEQIEKLLKEIKDEY